MYEIQTKINLFMFTLQLRCGGIHVLVGLLHVVELLLYAPLASSEQLPIGGL
jgi:hypothetical protein